MLRVASAPLPAPLWALLWVSACDPATAPAVETTPSPSSASATAETPVAELQCFSDGDHSLCLPVDTVPEPPTVEIDGTPVPFFGQWTPRGDRAAQLRGRLVDTEGPELATGPNGALRVGCAGRFRQFFKGARVDRATTPAAGQSTPAASFTAAGLCRHLGVGG